jgi:hypothetical protein
MTCCFNTFRIKGIPPPTNSSGTVSEHNKSELGYAVEHTVAEETRHGFVPKTRSYVATPLQSPRSYKYPRRRPFNATLLQQSPTFCLVNIEVRNISSLNNGVALAFKGEERTLP